MTPRLWFLLGALGLVAAGALALREHDARVARDATMRERIAVRDRAIAVRDRAIATRDKRLDSLKAVDAGRLRAAERTATERLAASAQAVDSLKAVIEDEARAHAGLVPLARVQVLEAHYEGELADCRALGATKDVRIVNLLTQVATHDTTRTDLNANRAASDSTRTELARALAPPPWYRRTYGWLADRAPAVALGTVLGLVIGGAVLP